MLLILKSPEGYTLVASPNQSFPGGKHHDNKHEASQPILKNYIQTPNLNLRILKHTKIPSTSSFPPPFYLKKKRLKKKQKLKISSDFCFNTLQPSKSFIQNHLQPSQRPTHDGENTRFVGELEKFQGNCNQILPGTPAAACFGPWFGAGGEPVFCVEKNFKGSKKEPKDRAQRR